MRKKTVLMVGGVVAVGAVAWWIFSHRRAATIAPNPLPPKVVPDQYLPLNTSAIGQPGSSTVPGGDESFWSVAASAAKDAVLSLTPLGVANQIYKAVNQ